MQAATAPQASAPDCGEVRPDTRWPRAGGPPGSQPPDQCPRAAAQQKTAPVPRPATDNYLQ